MSFFFSGGTKWSAVGYVSRHFYLEKKKNNCKKRVDKKASGNTSPVKRNSCMMNAHVAPTCLWWLARCCGDNVCSRFGCQKGTILSYLLQISRRGIKLPHRVRETRMNLFRFGKRNVPTFLSSILMLRDKVARMRMHTICRLYNVSFMRGNILQIYWWEFM